MVDFRSKHDLAQRVECEFGIELRRAGIAERLALTVDDRVDRTVQYVGSVTNAYKYEILNGSASIPSFINQVCFRTRNASSFLAEDASFRWGSVFYMIGGVCPLAKSSDLYIAISNALEHLCSASSAHVVLHCPPDLSIYAVAKPNATHLPNTQEDWKYGSDKIFGRGSTFYISDGVSKFEVGNIIDIYKDGKIWGVEFGFGVETIAASLLGRENAIIVRPIARFMKCDNAHEMIVADCIESSLLMRSCGISIGSRDKPRVLRNYLKSLRSHANMMCLPPMALDRIIQSYALDVGHDLKQVDYVMENVVNGFF